MNEKQMEYHECADIFPLMDDESLEKLSKDIKINGQLEAIVLYEGKILDGRNRYLACKKANIEPKYSIMNYNIDPVDFVVSKNLVRRQLTPAQKAESANRALELKKRLRTIQLESMDFRDNIEKEAIKESVLKKDKKELAKKHGTTTRAMEQVKEIKEKIEKEDDEELEEAFKKAKKDKISLEQVHSKINPSKKKVERIKYKEKYEELQMKLSFYRIIEKACKELDLWDKILEYINPKFESYKSLYTIEDYRKAELI